MVVGDFTGNGIDDIIVFSKNEAEGRDLPRQWRRHVPARDASSPPARTPYAAEAVDLDGNGIARPDHDRHQRRHRLRPDGQRRRHLRDPRSLHGRAARRRRECRRFRPGRGRFRQHGLRQHAARRSPEVAGTPGIYVTAQSRTGSGPGRVYFLPAQFDGQGQFLRVRRAPSCRRPSTRPGRSPRSTTTGSTELVATDTGGVRVIYGVPQPQPGGSSGSSLTVPPNTTLGTARDLGSAAHLVTQPQAIVAGYEDAYYTYHVPTEDVPGERRRGGRFLRPLPGRRGRRARDGGARRRRATCWAPAIGSGSWPPRGRC